MSDGSFVDKVKRQCGSIREGLVDRADVGEVVERYRGYVDAFEDLARAIGDDVIQCAVEFVWSYVTTLYPQKVFCCEVYLMLGRGDWRETFAVFRLTFMRGVQFTCKVDGKVGSTILSDAEQLRKELGSFTNRVEFRSLVRRLYAA